MRRSLRPCVNSVKQRDSALLRVTSNDVRPLVALRRTLSMAALCGPLASLFVSSTGTAGDVPGFAALCHKFYSAAACDQSLVRWLPEISSTETSAAPTLERDDIVDPAGTGEPRFLGMRGVFAGSLFVREAGGGPPKGHVVYDPDHHIAYYDEGCCSWHRVVVATTAEPPPRKIAMRSLGGLKTTRGIRLGDSPAHIRSIYGPAKLKHATAAGTEAAATLSYLRTITFKEPYTPCKELTTFLFERERLIGMSFDEGC